jgi:uncharacterized repeat protein (TIGR01451 family)
MSGTATDVGPTTRDNSSRTDAGTVETETDPTDRREDAPGSSVSNTGPATVVDESTATTSRRTKRWRGIVAVALVAAAVGLVADKPALVFLAVPAIVFAAYPNVLSPPQITETLDIDRRLSDEAPAPGDAVDVTVTLRNGGDSTLFDLRVVDGVPPALSVVDGSPRTGVALRPGGETTFTYTIRAEDGTHSFDPATVVARDPSGAWEVETTVGTDTSVDCAVGAATSQSADQTIEGSGRVISNQGGAGIEFHRTREYRRGDTMSRIDWNRYARSGELTTVEYREERATNVVLVVDARREAYRAAEDGPHAVARSVAAARQLFSALLDKRNYVGIAAFGRSSPWLEPGAGPNHRAQARRLFSTHAAFASTPPDETSPITDQVAQLRERLPASAQVVLLSPLNDDDVVRAAQVLRVHGHPVRVVSPDTTGESSVGQRVATVERENRLNRLRRQDVDVVDWRPDESLTVALAAAQEGRR